MEANCLLRSIFLPSMLFGMSFLVMSCATARKTGSGDAEFAQTGLVELVKLDPSLLLDIRYATQNNFTGKKVYPQARAFLQKEAALALMRVNATLREQGFCLKIYDAYRPLSVQKIFWQIMPDPRYVADPKLGSLHNRGMAVDVTLTDIAGNEVLMPTSYDDFSEKAHRDWKNAPAEAIHHRQILESAMHQEGFLGIPTEWWHFDFHGWGKYPVLDIPFPRSLSENGFLLRKTICGLRLRHPRKKCST